MKKLGLIVKLVLVLGLFVGVYGKSIITDEFGELDFYNDINFLDANDVFILSNNSISKNINGKEYIFIVVRGVKKGFLILTNRNQNLKTKMLMAVPLKYDENLDLIQDKNYSTIYSQRQKIEVKNDDSSGYIYTDNITLYQPNEYIRWLVVFEKLSNFDDKYSEEVFAENYPQEYVQDDFWNKLYYRKIVEEDIIKQGKILTTLIKATGNKLISIIDDIDEITHQINYAINFSKIAIKNPIYAKDYADVEYFVEKNILDDFETFMNASTVSENLHAKALETLAGGVYTAVQDPNLIDTGISLTNSSLKIIASTIAIETTKYYGIKLNNLLVAKKLAFKYFYFGNSDEEIFSFYGLDINKNSWTELVNKIAEEMGIYNYSGLCNNPLLLINNAIIASVCMINDENIINDIGSNPVEPKVIVNLYNAYKNQKNDFVNYFENVINTLPQDFDEDGIINEDDPHPNTPDTSLNNHPPKASFNFDKNDSKVGDIITATSTSTDSDGDDLIYTWALFTPIGSNIQLNNIHNKSVSFVPDVAGTYTLVLNVNDGKSNKNKFKSIKVISNNPSSSVIDSTSKYLLGNSNTGESGNKGWNKGLNKNDGWCVNVGENKNNGCYNAGNNVKELTLWLLDSIDDNEPVGIAARKDMPPTVKKVTFSSGNTETYWDKYDWVGEDLRKSSENIEIEYPKKGTYYFSAYAFGDFKEASIFFQIDYYKGEEQLDSDNDGISDEKDAFPNDPAASVDIDGDGYPDKWNDGYNQNDSTIGLVLDEYPNNASKWKKDSSAISIDNNQNTNIDILNLSPNDFNIIKGENYNGVESIGNNMLISGTIKNTKSGNYIKLEKKLNISLLNKVLEIKYKRNKTGFFVPFKIVTKNGAYIYYYTSSDDIPANLPMACSGKGKCQITCGAYAGGIIGSELDWGTDDNDNNWHILKVYFYNDKVVFDLDNGVKTRILTTAYGCDGNLPIADLDFTSDISLEIVASNYSWKSGELEYAVKYIKILENDEDISENTNLNNENTNNTQSLTKKDIIKLYVAMFQRAPSKAEIESWYNDAIKNNRDLGNMAETMLQAAMLAVNGFGLTDLYPQYANVDTNDYNSVKTIIESVYNTLFNKDYSQDPEGIDGWVNNVTSKKQTLGKAIASIVVIGEGIANEPDNYRVYFKDNTDFEQAYKAAKTFVNKIDASEMVSESIDNIDVDKYELEKMKEVLKNVNDNFDKNQFTYEIEDLQNEISNDDQNSLAGHWKGTSSLTLVDDPNTYCVWDWDIEINNDNMGYLTSRLVSHNNDDGYCAHYGEATFNVKKEDNKMIILNINSSVPLFGGNSDESVLYYNSDDKYSSEKIIYIGEGYYGKSKVTVFRTE